MARQSGLSTFTSCDFRSFEAHIILDLNTTNNIHYIYEKIRKYINPFKTSLKLCISSELMFYENKSYDILKITSIFEDDNTNDNDLFETIYTFLEYIFLSLSLTSLKFIFNGFDERKIYKIKNNTLKK